MTHRSALATVVCLGLAVRLWGITLSLPHVLIRPDELYILGTVIKMHAGQTNPGFWDYGGLYLYFVAGLWSIYYGIGSLAGWFSGPEHFVRSFSEHWEPFFLIPRVTGAALGAATVAVVYAIARRTLGRSEGLLSGLFLALAFLHVRDSHYATTDVFMTFFLMAAVLAAVQVDASRRAADGWLAGALAGCAIATKYNAVFIVLVLAAVEALHVWRLRHDWRAAIRTTQIWRMAAACVFVFVVTNPYLFLEWERARGNLEALRASSAGGMTPPDWLGRGWTYHLPYSLRFGLGLPLLLASLAGLGWMAFRQRRVFIILGIFPVAYYLFIGEAYNVFVRYVLPIVPFLCIFGGYTVAAVARGLAKRVGGVPAGAVAGILGLLVVAPSAWSVIQFDRLAARDDNRLVAAKWIIENVPEGSVIMMGGNRYGHPQLERGPSPRFTTVEFDRHARSLRYSGRPARGRQPDWIVLQRHPIPYANTHPSILEKMADFDLVHTIQAYDPDVKNFYDIQDGFYAPYGGFKGVRRFGPTFEIYRRRE